jgi:hypothetical protein
MQLATRRPKSLARASGLILLLIIVSLCCSLTAGPRTVDAADGADAVGSTKKGGLQIDFPNDPSLPYDKFGVFIGIGRYPGLPAANQLDGPAGDVTALKDIFQTTFGFKRIAMLTDEKATRENIGQVMLALVEQVRIAKQKTSGPISVVIDYAGHGSRVQRTAEGLKENPNSPEESTWVCADASGESAESGDKDFRASELFKIHTALAALGAQVVMISDACHSGSGFRGAGKIRALARTVAPAGPQNDLFPSLPNPTVAGTPEQQAVATSNFAWYAACANLQCAWESIDSNGIPHGHFSAALCELLPHVTRTTTYGELAAELTAKFATDTNQSPEFHAPAGKANERFLLGGFASPHAEIILPAHHGEVTDHVKLNMGTIHGVARGAKFTFYANSDDFENKKNPIAVLTVNQGADLEPLDCTLPVPSGTKIPPTAWADLDAMRMNDIRVGIDGTVPPPLAARLKDLAEKQQIALVDNVSNANLVIHFDEGQHMAGIYDATQLPSVKVPLSDSSQPKALRGLLPVVNAGDADAVCTNLLYLVRVRRLISLTHVRAGNHAVKCSILVQPDPDKPPVEAPTNLGVPQLLNDQEFTLRFTNNNRPGVGDTGLYLSIFSVDTDGGISFLYCSPPNEPLKAGQSHDIPGLQAKVEDPQHITDRGELTQVFVLATDRFVDFSQLVAPPDAAAGNSREVGAQDNGAGNPLVNLVKPPKGARGIAVPENTSWDSNQLTFYVDQPELHHKP